MNCIKNTMEQAITDIDDKFLEEAIFRKPVLRTIKRLAVSAAALFLLFFGSMSAAVACGSITAYEILYSLTPQIAQKLIPVYASCENKGIRMSVEAIKIEGSTAYIYISIQDLEGSRIDETVDLFDSYNIHTASGKIGGCSLISYDDAQKTATFLITVQQEDKIAGNFMTFSVSKLLTNKKEVTMKMPEILSATETDKVIPLSETDMGGFHTEEYYNSQPVKSVLTENESQYLSPADGITVTAYGYVEGKLHIQVHYENIHEFDNHGGVYLQKGDSFLDPETQYSFWDEEHTGRFYEYIYPVSSEELKDYDVWGEFVTSDTLIEGDWKVSFPIKNDEED